MPTRIVVIDSDESVRDLLTFFLEREGFQVLSFAYDQIKLAALATLDPDLLLLNFNPREEGVGWELLQLLKMDIAMARIPILVTTTELWLSAEIRHYLLTRYISVVQMPFDLSAFGSLVQTTLKLARRSGELLSSQDRLPVLVVDDSDEIRENLTLLLELENYPVVSANNGLVALNAVSQGDHSLILLDIAMPIMNGFEFLCAYEQQLRPHTPVIILSGENNIRVRKIPAFVVDVVPKPFAIKQLLSLVQPYAQRL